MHTNKCYVKLLCRNNTCDFRRLAITRLDNKKYFIKKIMLYVTVGIFCKVELYCFNFYGVILLLVNKLNVLKNTSNQ